MSDVERLAEDLVAERMRGIRALFRRQGARPPFLLWRPRDTDLPQRKLIDVKKYWQGLPEINGIAAAEAVRDLAQDPVSRNVLVMDVEADGGLRLSHVGRDLVADIGRDLTGERTDVFPPWVDRFVRAVCRAVMLRPEPIYTEHEASDRYFVAQWDRLVLPLADAKGQVNSFLVGVVADSPVRTIIDTVLDGVLALDVADRVRLANRPVAEMFGCEPNDLLGRPVQDLVDLDAAMIAGEAQIPAPLREASARRVDGSTFAVEISIGETRRRRQALKIAVLRDITERKVSEERIRRLAFTDPLTGIANRAVFEDRFRDASARARRHGSRLALLLLDLDRFKAINDRYGHPIGDAVLRETAARVRGVVRETDVFARLGGDEFAILQTDINQPEDTRPLVARLLRALQPRATFGDATFRLTVSIGIAVYPDDAASPEVLIQRADRALYVAKARRSSAHFAFWGEVVLAEEPEAPSTRS